MLAQGIPADSIKRAVAEVFTRPPYRWVERRALGGWVSERWTALKESLDAFEQSNPVLFKITLTALVVVLVLLLIHIGYVLWRVLRSAPEARVLPAGAGAGWDGPAHFDRADALAAEGRWAEALGHRFLGLVLELDRLRTLRFHPSKTPAEYVHEAKLDAPGRASLADVVGRLYGHVFGGAPCDAALYHAFAADTQLVIQHARSH